MRSLAFAFVVPFLAACDAHNAPATIDSSVACFPCVGYWICGERIDLTPEADGCYLRGLPGRTLLSSDGTITVDGSVIGKAEGTGARIRVLAPDGSQLLFCAGGGGCGFQPLAERL